MFNAKEDIVIREIMPHEIDEVRQLRYDVLLDGKQTASERAVNPEDLDPTTINVAAFHGHKVVSAVRLQPIPSSTNIYLVSRLVTAARYENQGIGSRVLEFAESIAIKIGASNFFLEARPSKEKFYAKRGYSRTSILKPQKEGEIPMFKQVAS